MPYSYLIWGVQSSWSFCSSPSPWADKHGYPIHRRLATPAREKEPGFTKAHGWPICLVCFATHQKLDHNPLQVPDTQFGNHCARGTCPNSFLGCWTCTGASGEYAKNRGKLERKKRHSTQGPTKCSALPTLLSVNLTCSLATNCHWLVKERWIPSLQMHASHSNVMLCNKPGKRLTPGVCKHTFDYYFSF